MSLEVKCWWRLSLPSQSPHLCGPATKQLQSSVVVEAYLCRCCIGPGDMGNCCWFVEGVSVEGGPAHPDDTYRGALQSEQTAGASWLLDHIDEEMGMKGNPYQPLTFNSVYPCSSWLWKVEVFALCIHSVGTLAKAFFPALNDYTYTCTSMQMTYRLYSYSLKVRIVSNVLQTLHICCL